MNTRYEGSKLNLRLRSRYLKGNFKIIQIGSLINLTFPNINITSNTKVFKSLIEGNNLFCQEFVNSLNPILISNAEIFKRRDSFGFVNMLNYLGKHINLFSRSNNKSQLNILHPALGDVGFINFTSLKTLQNKDLNNAAGVYFINNSLSSSNIKKLLNLKLLNFFKNDAGDGKILITQNSSLNTKLIAELKRGFNWKNHVHLPTTVFFETSGTYISTEGNVNKVSRIIKPLGQTKDNWQIIRKILSYSTKMLFMVNFFNDNKLTFNSNTLSHFNNYIGFQYYAVSSLNDLTFSSLKRIATHRHDAIRFKSKKKKVLSSQFKF